MKVLSPVLLVLMGLETRSFLCVCVSPVPRSFTTRAVSCRGRAVSSPPARPVMGARLQVEGSALKSGLCGAGRSENRT